MQRWPLPGCDMWNHIRCTARLEGALHRLLRHDAEGEVGDDAQPSHARACGEQGQGWFSWMHMFASLVGAEKP